MNPFNPEAGATPAPADPEDVAIVEHSARVIWRAFPYFEWRYGDRGRSFGRSDAGFLATLTQLDEGAARQQVLWLARLLAARGMPSVLLEFQLESLGRAAQRRRRPASGRLLELAAGLRTRRLGALRAGVTRECEELCRAATGGVRRRRGAGFLIASAVADSAVGIGEHDEALVRWLSGAENGDPTWSSACGSARALAQAGLVGESL